MLWIVLFLITLTCVRFSLSIAEKRSEPPSPTLKATGETLEVAIIAFCVIFLVVRPFVAQAFYIPSLSMAPTLRENDRILVNKLSYRFGNIRRGEVLVFRAPNEASLDPEDAEEKDFVKRVIGLPGDVIEIANGVTYVNGRAQREPYLRESMHYDLDAFTVPEGKLFVMGDNRNHSNDSHRWGALDRGRVIGRAVFVFWPPSRAGAIR
jgi:signal peptidase I